MGRGDSMREQQDLKETTRFSGEKSSIFKTDFPEWKPKIGDNYIKLLPPKDYKDNLESPFGIYVFIHWEGSDSAPVLCPKRMKNVMSFLVEKGVIDKIPEEVVEGKCPICEEQSKIYASTGGDKNHPNFGLSKSLHPQEKLLLFVVDTSSDTEIEKGVQIYLAPSQKVWKQGIFPLLQPKRGKKAGEAIDISSPENKKDVYFSRTGKERLDTVYGGFELVDSELSIEEVEELINELPDSFVDILNFVSYEDITDEVPETEGEDDPEKPVESDRTSRRRGTSRVPENNEEEPTPTPLKATQEEDEEKTKVKEELKRKFRRRTQSDG